MSFNGQPIKSMLYQKDGFHLSPKGTSILASNLRKAIYRSLGLDIRDDYEATGFPGYGNYHSDYYRYNKNAYRGWNWG